MNDKNWIHDLTAILNQDDIYISDSIETAAGCQWYSKLLQDKEVLRLLTRLEIYGLLRDIPTLPAGISKLENLEILNLSGNGLISLSPEIVNYKSYAS